MENPSKEEIHTIHAKGLEIARDYKRCEYRLVELLSQMDECNGYLLFKCESLRQYAMSLWELPENAVSDLVTVAKKALEIPEMIEALRENRATVSKLRKVCPVISQENHKDWLALVAECPTRTIEKAVAMAKPEAVITEQLDYVGVDRLRLKTEVSEELAEKIQRAQDLISRSNNAPATLWQTIEVLVDEYIERHDPVRRSDRANARRSRASTSALSGRHVQESAATGAEANAEQEIFVTGRGLGVRADVERCKPIVDVKNVTSFTGSERRGIANASNRIAGGGKRNADANDNANSRITLTAALKYAIATRDKDQCTYIDDGGNRCANRRWLHVHHIRAVSDGGTNRLENLTTLCSGHHRVMHFRSL